MKTAIEIDWVRIAEQHEELRMVIVRVLDRELRLVAQLCKKLMDEKDSIPAAYAEQAVKQQDEARKDLEDTIRKIEGLH